MSPHLPPAIDQARDLERLLAAVRTAKPNAVPRSETSARRSEREGPMTETPNVMQTLDISMIARAARVREATVAACSRRSWRRARHPARGAVAVTADGGGGVRRPAAGGARAGAHPASARGPAPGDAGPRRGQRRAGLDGDGAGPRDGGRDVAFTLSVAPPAVAGAGAALDDGSRARSEADEAWRRRAGLELEDQGADPSAAPRLSGLYGLDITVGRCVMDKSSHFSFGIEDFAVLQHGQSR